MIPITPVERARLQGFNATLRIRGRAMSTDQQDALTAVVETQPILADIEHTAQAKQPVYVVIHALAGSVVNPRTITVFTETVSGRNYEILRYEENAADNVGWKWFCEAQRMG